jgi:hypothetical protein
MESIPGMAQGGLRISGWLMSVADKIAMVNISNAGVFVRICGHFSKSSDSISGQRTR